MQMKEYLLEKYNINIEDPFYEVIDNLYLQYNLDQALAILKEILIHSDVLWNEKFLAAKAK